jgi:hypothetical protein
MATTCAIGSRRTNVANGTTQVFTGRTAFMHLVVTNAAAGDSIAVYDDTSGTANPVLEWLAAEGKGRFEARVPISNGIRVVATITTTRAYLVWGV